MRRRSVAGCDGASLRCRFLNGCGGKTVCKLSYATEIVEVKQSFVSTTEIDDVDVQTLLRKQQRAEQR